MIFRDRVIVLRRVVVGRDDYGNDVYEDVPTAYPAEVRPLGSQEPINGPVVTRYRLFLGRTATDVSAADAVTWRGQALELQGEVESHSMAGRLHHHEVIGQRAT